MAEAENNREEAEVGYNHHPWSKSTSKMYHNSIFLNIAITGKREQQQGGDDNDDGDGGDGDGDQR